MTNPHSKLDHEDLCNLRATQVLDLLKQKAISPIDLVDASIKRIEAVDKKINALPVRRFKNAREEAKSISFEKEIQNPHSLHELPITVKD